MPSRSEPSALLHKSAAPRRPVQNASHRKSGVLKHSEPSVLLRNPRPAPSKRLAQSVLLRNPRPVPSKRLAPSVLLRNRRPAWKRRAVAASRKLLHGKRTSHVRPAGRHKVDPRAAHDVKAAAARRAVQRADDRNNTAADKRNPGR